MDPNFWGQGEEEERSLPPTRGNRIWVVLVLRKNPGADLVGRSSLLCAQIACLNRHAAMFLFQDRV